MNRFGIGTERHFFKTSHGKSDCDNGNNGITKGLVVMARLEKTLMAKYRQQKKCTRGHMNTLTVSDFVMFPLNTSKKTKICIICRNLSSM